MKNLGQKAEFVNRKVFAEDPNGRPLSNHKQAQPMIFQKKERLTI
jgi:hypothetical protein